MDAQPAKWQECFAFMENIYIFESTGKVLTSIKSIKSAKEQYILLSHCYYSLYSVNMLTFFICIINQN